MTFCDPPSPILTSAARALFPVLHSGAPMTIHGLVLRRTWCQIEVMALCSNLSVLRISSGKGMSGKAMEESFRFNVLNNGFNGFA
ncbi:hypothetical protein CDAR_590751 [Caerostris darwini]|uniref:Uncharacterized protein n=1 Tax=Caerostris darwini TaxID=1538125 RepID=A0AAV4VVC9_9ARAC|nr:hypothetical protein CDAR_590751 [Caerostris darwini]